MTHTRKKQALAFVAGLDAGAYLAWLKRLSCLFTWEGKGAASFISEGGIEEIDFQFELSMDDRGWLTERQAMKTGLRE